MRHIIFFVFVAIILVSCSETRITRDRMNREKQDRVQHYIETAGHLNEEQRHAIECGKPFLGMTFEEAEIAMTLTDWLVKFQGKVLKALFMDRGGRQYVVFFDAGDSNRVNWWSVFTDEMLEELLDFPNVHPDPPGLF